jgi:hypothetical protein
VSAAEVPSELVEAVPLLILILEVPGSNVCRHIDFLAESFRSFHQSFQKNGGVVLRVRRRPLSVIPFHINYSQLSNHSVLSYLNY